MMAKRLAIRRNHQGSARRDLRRGRCNRIRQRSTIGKTTVERNQSRKLPIETKYRQALPARAPDERTGAAMTRCLATKDTLFRRQDDKLDTRGGDVGQRVEIGSTFGQPHAFGLAAEAHDEVLDSPGDLQCAVTRMQ